MENRKQDLLSRVTRSIKYSNQHSDKYSSSEFSSSNDNLIKNKRKHYSKPLSTRTILYTNSFQRLLKIRHCLGSSRKSGPIWISINRVRRRGKTPRQNIPKIRVCKLITRRTDRQTNLNRRRKWFWTDDYNKRWVYLNFFWMLHTSWLTENILAPQVV